MSKLVLDAVTNLQDEPTAVGVINANAELISAAFDNTFSRDGLGPNNLQADVDANSHRIYNLPSPLTPTEPLRALDLELSLPAGASSDTIAAYFSLVTAFSSVAGFQVALVPVSAPYAILTGYYVPGDIGRTVLLKRVTSGTVHFTSGDGAHWRIAESVISPLMFGAKADGVTDDTSSFQNAISFAEELHGILDVPQGNYKITGTLNITSGLTIRGAGKNNQYPPYIGPMILPTGFFTVFAITTLQAVNILGVNILYSGTPTDSVAITIHGSSGTWNLGSTFRDISIVGCYGGINAVECGQGTFDNINIAGWTGYGIIVSNDLNPDAGDCSIVNCNIGSSGGTISPSSFCIKIRQGGIKVTSCKTIGGLVAVWLSWPNKGLSGDLFITGNSFEGSNTPEQQYSFFATRESGSDPTGFGTICITGNELAGSQQPVMVLPDARGAWIQGISLVGNLIASVTSTGPIGLVNFDAVTRFIIEGNVIENLSGSVSATGIILTSGCYGTVGLNDYYGLVHAIGNFSPGVSIATREDTNSATIPCNTGVVTNVFKGTVDVSFSVVFTDIPRVTTTAFDSNTPLASGVVAGSITTSGCTLYGLAPTSSDITVQWVAHGN